MSQGYLKVVENKLHKTPIYELITQDDNFEDLHWVDYMVIITVVFVDILILLFLSYSMVHEQPPYKQVSIKQLMNTIIVVV